ncbi:50S ribosomal protein L9 [Buchnera aphidicola (Periphyllus testudinaceus)]|uniref:50S ribosomal protein L9 n=1 Tax=Buchnera aphidicola TaxID=9 RepID=UPI0034648E63
MNVILLISFNKLGKLGDMIQVKPGYARNFLFPKEIAIPAIKKNIEYFKNYKKNLKNKLEKKLFISRSRIEEIKKIKNIVIFSKSGKKGKLFGSIGVRDISRKLNELGIKVKKSEIKLKNGLLRSLGEHIVLFQPHKDISTNIKIIISSENK